MKDIPLNPGIYIFKGLKEKVLYVGKAKNLRNRLRSYFQKSAKLEPRKEAMVRMIRDLSFIVTDNELEALILEASLIKQYKPQFNIILRDDKNYPYIRITTAEQWPRIEVVRRVANDGNEYFGPYVPAQSMWEALDFIRRNFIIRTCGYPLDKPMRPCIQHQMRRCPAPCAGRISRKEYFKIVDDVVLFLKGKNKGLLDKLEKDMHHMSDELRFEEAATLRDRIFRLRQAFESQKVIAPELGDMDIIGDHLEGEDVAVQVLFLRNGIIIGGKDFIVDRGLAIKESEVMHGFIELFYAKDIVPPPSILTNVQPYEAKSLSAWLRTKRGDKVSILSPRQGKERELIRMANDNARIHYNSRRKPAPDEVPAALMERLNLRRLPLAIGAFDVSTIQGSEPVGAFVYWQDGDFRKDMYRRFKIRDVQGMDDYSMMREIVQRALSKARGKTVVNSADDILIVPTGGGVEKNAAAGDIVMPDLIMVDGGRGHLEVAHRVLKDLGLNVDIIGIAKDPDRAVLLDGGVVDLEDRARASLLLKRIRDEVHRFAVTFHRKLRDKRLMDSPLEKVHGIGPKKRLELLRHFSGLENIRKASADEIAKLKGFNKKVAEKILEELKEKKI